MDAGRDKDYVLVLLFIKYAVGEDVLHKITRMK